MAEEKGEKLADKHYTADIRTEFVKRCLFPSIKANGMYEGYPMGTSLARPLIAEKIVEVAKSENATAVAHGCTGKGNDQLRFDIVFRTYGYDIIAPMRERNMTREWEIEYARQHNVPIPVDKEHPWSTDENLWSRSIEGGLLENPSYHPPEEIYAWTKSVLDAPEKPTDITISFEEGVPVALNKKQMDGLSLITELNTIAGENGVGRNNMIENRVLGIKAREIYEHPAATTLITAHADLERLVLTREEYAFKQMVDAKWAELAYGGLVYEPLYEALNAFIDQTQKRVTGTVDLQLYKGNVIIQGRESTHSFYSEDIVSFDSCTIDQKHAIGVSHFYGLQARLSKQKELRKA
jgi:argininosuccinate synthase